ncbi:MAG: hypothetical protein RR053_00690 [Evtepia sp.]
MSELDPKDKTELDPKDKTELDPPKKEVEKRPETPLRTRILAWIGVVFMVALVIFYTYSVASGHIMDW